MARILQLDAHVADLIAAGEVVERPASVVKELMENAIDAGATSVTVEIKNGGMTYIRVTDNGCGIASDDAQTAFLRHATSKLRDERGLEAITTLGFRGEALAAIAAVSRIELLTREAGAPEGTGLVIEGGTVTEKTAAGCPDGTTMIVRDLFFNTPARQKFMKTDRAEGAAVSAQIICCALSHPEVSVRYLKDGKEECHTPGDGQISSCVYSIFGRDFAGSLLEATTSDGDISVSGFVSSPSAARGNRSYQFFFVNGRHVKSKTLQAALEQAYKNTLFTGRFPACVLYVTLRPSCVDVNVHPTKTEVKFLNDHQAFDGVYYAARSSLEGETQRPLITLSPGTSKVLSSESQPTAPNTYSNVTNGGRLPDSSPPPQITDRHGRLPGGFKSRVPSATERPLYASVRDETRVAYQSLKTPGDSAAIAVEAVTVPIAEMPTQREHRIVGEALDTYIIAEQAGTLWLIDKHAAHERIHFDRLKDQKQVTMSQLLMTPVICQLGREDMALVQENITLFEQLGFQIDAFGDGSVAIRQIPADILIDGAEAVLEELCTILRRSGALSGEARRDALLQSIACKAAIKAGRASEPMEIETLVKRVLSGDVRYCPHGRPVAVELTKTALDKYFKRT
ncbi:DNA mismatch repair endonuclease MutL [Oscillospiraceae bacterium CM]|nr:DNA mismatch repair endonuclease MutL [Oscillospiraceae bacterium CM]